MNTHQDHIDSLLQRYLLLLDEYTRLRTQLSTLQASVFRDIARANFSAERGLRYGQDQYDERMQASRIVSIEMKYDLSTFKIVDVSKVEGVKEDEVEEKPVKDEEGEAADVQDESNEGDEKKKPGKKEKKNVSKDPLRWFGLLTPQSLRTAQASSIEAVSTVIPRLATLEREMSQLEIEVRRARKKRAKAETAAGKEASTAGTGIKAN